MSDLTERLEHYARTAMPHYPNDICSQAKQEIERLRAQLAKANADAEMWQDKYCEEAFYESGGVPCLWSARALKTEEQLASARKALQFIADGYENHDINHVDYRVKVYQVATETLEEIA